MIAAFPSTLAVSPRIRIARPLRMIHQSVKRFGEKIMRRFNNLERDRTQNRIPLLLIALVKR